MEPVWMNRAVRGWTTLTAGKVLDLLAAALALQGLGDVIPFQAGLPPPRALRSHPETSATEKRGFEIYRAAVAVHPRPGIFDGKKDHLLLLRQMCIFSASAMSCSRKSGWAMEMMASARSQVDRPFRLIMPYSVTT